LQLDNPKMRIGNPTSIRILRITGCIIPVP
jgi:hypothetical protein